MNTPKVIKRPYIQLRRLFKPKKKTAGLPPGSPVYTGEVKKDEKINVSLIDYKGHIVNEKVINNPKECRVYTENDSISWIDVDGIHDVELVQNITNSINIHPLVVEDILNVDQRSKLDEYDGYIYIVLKMFHIGNSNSSEIIPEQVSIIFGKNFVVTFQEGIEGDTFQEIRNRIRSNKDRKSVV